MTIKNKAFRLILSILLGFLFTYVANSMNALWSVAFCIKAIIYSGFIFVFTGQKIEKNKVFLIGSLFLSFFLSLGKETAEYSSLNWLNVFVYMCMSFPCFYLLVNYVSNLNKTLLPDFHTKWIRKPFIRIIINLACWTPYLFAFWPGILQVDTYRGLFDFQKEVLNFHHSFVYSLIFEIFGTIGLHLIGKEGTILFPTLFNAISFVLILNTCIDLCKEKLSDFEIMCITLFFSLCPHFPLAAILICKDVLYSSLLVYALLLFYFGKGKKFQIPAILLFCCYLRNNTVYVAALWLIYLLIKKADKKFLTKIAVVLILFVSSKSLITRYGNVNSDGKTELFGPLLQQMDRVYAKTDYFSQDEREYIESLLQINTWKYYVYQNGDPAKNHIDTSKLDWKFWKLYLKAGMDNPNEYIKALTFIHRNAYYPDTIIETFGNNIYLDYEHYRSSRIEKEIPSEVKIIFKDWYDPRSRTSVKNSKWPGLQDAITKMCMDINFEYIPVISKILNPGSYSYLLIIAFIKAIKNKDENGKQTYMFGFVLLLSMFGAVCVLTRYYYPFIFASPFILMFIIKKAQANA